VRVQQLLSLDPSSAPWGHRWDTRALQATCADTALPRLTPLAIRNALIVSGLSVRTSTKSMADRSAASDTPSPRAFEYRLRSCSFRSPLNLERYCPPRRGSILLVLARTKRWDAARGVAAKRTGYQDSPIDHSSLIGPSTLKSAQKRASGLANYFRDP